MSNSWQIDVINLFWIISQLKIFTYKTSAFTNKQQCNNDIFKNCISQLKDKYFQGLVCFQVLSRILNFNSDNMQLCTFMPLWKMQFQ